MLLCHIRVSEWIYTLYLPEWQGNPYSKQAPYLKFKWLWQDSNLHTHNHLIRKQTLNPLAKLVIPLLPPKQRYSKSIIILKPTKTILINVTHFIPLISFNHTPPPRKTFKIRNFLMLSGDTERHRRHEMS